MSKGRIYRARMTGVGDVKGRIYRAQMTGTAPVAGKGRVYRARMTGTAAVVLLPFTSRLVEPLSSQSITATLAPGSATPDSYTWRILPGGTSVSLSGTGATVTCSAPAHESGTYVDIGVRAAFGLIQSTEQVIRITTNPQQDWALSLAGVWEAIPPTEFL